MRPPGGIKARTLVSWALVSAVSLGGEKKKEPRFVAFVDFHGAYAPTVADFCQYLNSFLAKLLVFNRGLWDPQRPADNRPLPSASIRHFSSGPQTPPSFCWQACPSLSLTLAAVFQLLASQWGAAVGPDLTSGLLPLLSSNLDPKFLTLDPLGNLLNGFCGAYSLLSLPQLSFVIASLPGSALVIE